MVCHDNYLETVQNLTFCQTVEPLEGEGGNPKVG